MLYLVCKIKEGRARESIFYTACRSNIKHQRSMTSSSWWCDKLSHSLSYLSALRPAHQRIIIEGVCTTACVGLCVRVCVYGWREHSLMFQSKQLEFVQTDCVGNLVLLDSYPFSTYYSFHVPLQTRLLSCLPSVSSAATPVYWHSREAGDQWTKKGSG